MLLSLRLQNLSFNPVLCDFQYLNFPVIYRYCGDIVSQTLSTAFNFNIQLNLPIFICPLVYFFKTFYFH